MQNTELWDKVSRPPADALRQITGGRLSGKTDIKPQWRYRIMTETFGPCGIGWKYTIDKLWTEAGSDNQVFAFAMVSVFVKVDGAWSDAIPGQGGSMLVEKERSGMFSSDEGFKMAITDALSVSLKMLGVAGEVYMGNWDGAKYKNAPEVPPQKPAPTPVKTKRSEFERFMVENKERFTVDQLAIIRPEFTAAGTTDALLDALKAKADGFLAANDKATREAFDAAGFEPEVIILPGRGSTSEGQH